MATEKSELRQLAPTHLLQALDAIAMEIKHKGRKYHLGLFETPEESYSTYIQKQRELHAACTI